MHGGPHMDKMMGGGKYKMGHGGMYGKKKILKFVTRWVTSKKVE